MNITDLKIQHIDETQRKPKQQDETQLGFGIYLTDHYFSMEFDKDKKWHNARIDPYRAFRMDPASLVFHYGQSIFDGMKAFYGIDGKIRTFRLSDYVKRFNRSARRLCMPEVDEDFFLETIRILIRIDKDWIPKSKGTALYIRPCMIASEASLGVKVSSEYLCFVIGCAVGAYYKEGFDPSKFGSLTNIPGR